MEFVLILLLLTAVVLAVTWPLRHQGKERVAVEAPHRADLEAAREAKYREIRDAEMDLRTGKLSAEDHRALDRELRAEAIQILRELDALEA